MFARLINYFSSHALVGLLTLPLLAGGCSTFNYEWKMASKHPHPAGSLEGRWEGTWKSDSNGHNDRLRCLISKQPGGHYLARYYANYGRMLTFGYTARLDAQETAGAFKFAGSADLGWYAGGVYRYEGRAEGTNFFSTYRCPSDHGVFQMTRPR